MTIPVAPTVSAPALSAGHSSTRWLSHRLRLPPTESGTPTRVAVDLAAKSAMGQQVGLLAHDIAGTRGCCRGPSRRHASRKRTVERSAREALLVSTRRARRAGLQARLVGSPHRRTHRAAQRLNHRLRATHAQTCSTTSIPQGGSRATCRSRVRRLHVRTRCGQLDLGAGATFFAQVLLAFGAHKSSDIVCQRVSRRRVAARRGRRERNSSAYQTPD